MSEFDPSSTDTPTPAVAHVAGGIRGLLSNRLLLALLTVSLLPLAVMGYATYQSAAGAIEQQAQQQHLQPQAWLRALA